ncbi:hypothetical protein TTHERM_000717708 (macronuclear) [Tetrahymena thermophila SB210]|uniref:Uncharacterized protein n=1 Tax=Tetrahymena thermophila (strain SB210) TaxID=312017 RepID=W7X2X7_TETTS|nr:hypothetical protein TTHERM_000717708 [Tetrahymena thermophila SB210]EWS73675.1 hypothetical protein TTHERM_000717708 [Tetrahymena thermophila SB210]|eukprot:XP_012653805.1 hypothetical protein TTHERM_000717708 [Tetrahymena thermophila SB210]
MASICQMENAFMNVAFNHRASPQINLLIHAFSYRTVLCYLIFLQLRQQVKFNISQHLLMKLKVCCFRQMNTEKYKIVFSQQINQLKDTCFLVQIHQAKFLLLISFLE